MKKEKKDIVKKEKKIDKRIVSVIVAFVLIIIGGLLFSNIKNDNDTITRVSRILNNKYDSIRCINSDCDAVLVSENGAKKTSIKIYDAYGKIVGKYTEKNSEKNKKNPYRITKKYILVQKYISEKNTEYYMTDTKGKEVYKTKNRLLVLNDDYAVMQEDSNIDYVYTIIDSKGKVVYDKITDYAAYDNGKYIYIKRENKNYVLDKNCKTILKNYEVTEEVTNKNGKLEYMIVRNSTNSLYYYFNTSKSIVVGDGFSNYTKKDDNTLEIEKSENNKNVKYSVNKSGKTKKIGERDFMSSVMKRIKSELDEDKFYIYSISVTDENQNKVLVDNMEEKSLGIYDIDSKKYTEIYKYNSDKIYSTVSKLENDVEDLYLQFSCTSNVCEETQMRVYNFTKNEELFSLSGKDLVASNYTQYENGYKVVKYSYKSENSDYKGQYVLYGKDNKEILKSETEIIVIDSKKTMGSIGEDNLILYSSKSKKQLNDKDNLASKVETSSDENYYKYKNSDNKNVIVNEKGKEIYSVDSGGIIEYSSGNVFAFTDTTIKIYNVKLDKVSTYKFKKNETIYDVSNNKMLPYGGVAFVGNKEGNYVKIIDSNGNLLREIKHSKIKNVEINKKHKKAFIIVSSKNKNKIKYGLYIAK